MTGTGNLNSDPLFVNVAQGNFRITGSSPVIDQADPYAPLAVDIDGHYRPQGRRCDIGAYEYSAPTISGIRIMGTDCILDFTSVPGAYYDLQRTIDLAAQTWIPAITNIPGAEGSTEVVDTNAARQLRLFYRLRSSL